MNTQNTIRSLFLMCVALASVALGTLNTRADAQGMKPYKGTEHMLSRNDALGFNYWDDTFLEEMKASAEGYYAGDSEQVTEGRDNVGGRYTKTNHQVLYITGFGPGLVPLTATVYIWSEAEYVDGRKAWGALIGEVDFTTGIAQGTWTSYGEDDPSSPATGSGTWTAVDTGDRIYDSVAIGRVLTVGAAKM